MKRRLLLAGLLGLLLSACAPRLSATAAPSGEAPVATSGQPAAGAAGAPTPTLRPAMEATDPTTVLLGDGTPALVEFFAFW
jgi:hypothetical protein